MRRRLCLSGLVLALFYLRVAGAQYPVMDAIANKIIIEDD
jgi:hypothetical protein